MITNVAALMAAAGESAEFQQFLTRITAPNTAHKNAYRTCINGLVTDGVWTKLDALYLFAAADSATARTNLKSSSYGATLTGSPTFTADQGFSGGSTTAYVNTNLNSSTAGGNATQNSFHFSVWDNANPTPDAGRQVGVDGGDQQHIYVGFGGTTYFRVGETSGISVGTNFYGFYLGNRSSSSNIQGYFNGSSVVTSTSNTSNPLDNVNWTFPGATSSGSADPLLGGSIGGSLTSGEVLALYNRMHAYLQAIAGIA